MAVELKGKVAKVVYVPISVLGTLTEAVERSGEGVSGYMLAAALRQAERDNAKAEKEANDKLADATQADELSRAVGL